MAWNKPFKANVTEKYDELKVGEAHSFTPAGNDVCSTPERDCLVDPCDVGWLRQKNDNKFIQELRADSFCGWIRGRTHSPLQRKAALPCRARTAQGCSTSQEAIHATRILSTGSPNRTSKMPHQTQVTLTPSTSK